MAKEDSSSKDFVEEYVFLVKQQLQGGDLDDFIFYDTPLPLCDET